MSTDYDPTDGVKHLMRVTGLGRETVKAAIRTGELPGYLVGHRYTVPEDAFRAFCEGRWVATIRPIFTQEIRPLVQRRRDIAS